MALLNGNMSGFEKVFSIYTVVTCDSPLVQWTEVPGQLGLLHCTHQSTSNIIILAVKTDKIMVRSRWYSITLE